MNQQLFLFSVWHTVCVALSMRNDDFLTINYVCTLYSTNIFIGSFVKTIWKMSENILILVLNEVLELKPKTVNIREYFRFWRKSLVNKMLQLWPKTCLSSNRRCVCVCVIKKVIYTYTCKSETFIFIIICFHKWHFWVLEIWVLFFVEHCVYPRRAGTEDRAEVLYEPQDRADHRVLGAPAGVGGSNHQQLVQLYGHRTGKH